ncbi:apolipoprotein D-like [Mya arenaria]|uniref:apolipoprotein D-like n=1 Tax=Mya arenaria TaxID=6604 RepID=UPI0022E05A0D|nr:apolipoprotein D-like [Mya arenaria]
MRLTFVIQLMAACTTRGFLISADQCMSPPTAKDYANENYYGLWYEIGKIQTPGGAAFEQDCVCTTIDVFAVKGATNGDSTAINSCRKLTPSGDFLNATGALTNEESPGHWKESFFPLTPKADYRIIYLTDNLAIEYDCTSVLWITNYCVHLLSRTPTISEADEQELLNFANGLNLNSQNIRYKRTLQKGCW